MTTRSILRAATFVACGALAILATAHPLAKVHRVVMRAVEHATAVAHPV